MKEIIYLTGDATAPETKGPKIIVHVCNNIGAWGKGFVMAISNRWPEPESQYKKWYILFAPDSPVQVQISNDSKGELDVFKMFPYHVKTDQFTEASGFKKYFFI